MISVECARCGWLYEVDRSALLAGNWRRCPVCDEATGGESVELEEESSHAVRL